MNNAHTVGGVNPTCTLFHPYVSLCMYPSTCTKWVILYEYMHVHAYVGTILYYSRLSLGKSLPGLPPWTLVAFPLVTYMIIGFACMHTLVYPSIFFCILNSLSSSPFLVTVPTNIVGHTQKGVCQGSPLKHMNTGPVETPCCEYYPLQLSDDVGASITSITYDHCSVLMYPVHWTLYLFIP